MRLLLCISLCFLAFQVNAQGKPGVYFIAKDSIDENEYIVSRILINSASGFYYPTNVEIFIDSSLSNFGVFELEYFDSARILFNSYAIRWYIDKIYEEPDYSLKSSSQLHLKLTLANAKSLRPGLYRARAKIWLHRYNSKLKDVTSDWSYFYIQ